MVLKKEADYTPEALAFLKSLLKEYPAPGLGYMIPLGLKSEHRKHKLDQQSITINLSKDILHKLIDGEILSVIFMPNLTVYVKYGEKQWEESE